MVCSPSRTFMCAAPPGEGLWDENAEPSIPPAESPTFARLTIMVRFSERLPGVRVALRGWLVRAANPPNLIRLVPAKGRQHPGNRDVLQGAPRRPLTARLLFSEGSQ